MTQPKVTDFNYVSSFNCRIFKLISAQSEAEASDTYNNLAEFSQECGAKKSLTIFQTFARTDEWTTFDDDHWRCINFQGQFKKKYRTTRIIHVLNQAGSFWGKSLLVFDATEEDLKAIAEATYSANYATFDIDEKVWTDSNAERVSIRFDKDSHLSHVSEDPFDAATSFVRAIKRPAKTLTSEALADLRDSNQGYGFRYDEVLFQQLNAVSTPWVKDLTWVEALGKYESYRPYYMEIMAGARNSIPYRSSGEFIREGFDPLSYYALCHALDTDELFAHPNNIYNHRRKRFGGGRQGREQIIRGSEFRAFPKLLQHGVSPVTAARLILDSTGIQEDLLQKHAHPFNHNPNWQEWLLGGSRQLSIDELVTRLDALAKEAI
jgi:hypothetical protein